MKQKLRVKLWFPFILYLWIRIHITAIQEAPKARSTRTKQRLLASESEGSSSDSITKNAASPRVKVQNAHEVCHEAQLLLTI